MQLVIFFYLYLVFHACAAKFDVMGNLVKFWVFDVSKQGLSILLLVRVLLASTCLLMFCWYPCAAADGDSSSSSSFSTLSWKSLDEAQNISVSCCLYLFSSFHCISLPGVCHVLYITATFWRWWKFLQNATAAFCLYLIITV